MVTKHRQLLKLRACCAKGPMSLDIAINAHPTVFICTQAQGNRATAQRARFAKCVLLSQSSPSASLSHSLSTCVCMHECDGDNDSLLRT